MKKVKRKSVRRLDASTNKRILGLVQRAILKRLASMGKTRHWLAIQTGMRTATMYDYLAGKRATRSDKIEAMLKLLDLEVRPKE